MSCNIRINFLELSKFDPELADLLLDQPEEVIKAAELAIETEYLEEFKANMEESDKRLKTLAQRKSDEIISSFRNARIDRGKYTYELGQIAELKSVETAIRRADAFDILTNKLIAD